MLEFSKSAKKTGTGQFCKKAGEKAKNLEKSADQEKSGGMAGRFSTSPA